MAGAAGLELTHEREPAPGANLGALCPLHRAQHRALDVRRVGPTGFDEQGALVGLQLQREQQACALRLVDEPLVAHREWAARAAAVLARGEPRMALEAFAVRAPDRDARARLEREA